MPRNSSQWRLLKFLAQNLKEEMREKQNIIAPFKFFLFLFDRNDVSVTNAFEKITVTGDGSNNLGVWGQSPHPPEGWGRSSQRCSDFPVFFKNKAFFAYFGLNYCLETCFK